MKRILLTLAALFMAGTMSAQTLINEGFNSGLPSGWTMINDQNTPYYSDFNGVAWTWMQSYGNPGGCMATTSLFSPSAQADRWLITPQLTIPAAGYVLRYEAMKWNASYTDRLSVYVSTTGNNKEDFTLVETNTPGINYTEFVIDLSAYAGEDIYIGIADQSSNQYVVSVDNVFVGMLPENEIRITEFTLPDYINKNTPTDISLTVQNRGSSNLTSFDATFILEGNTTTEHVSGINVASNASYTFTFSTQFNQSEMKEYTINVSVSNPNGEEDNMSDNTASFTTMVYDAEKAVQRTVLMEHFTTAKCPNCPPADQRLHQAIHGRNDVIWLSHHAGYYTDNLTIPFSNNYTNGALWFYANGGSTYAPAMMLDRTRFNESNPGPVMSVGNVDVITSYFDKAASVPTYVEINIDDVHFTGRTLNVTVSGRFTADVDVENARLSVYLIEDSIKMAQSGATGTFWHEHVLRATLSDGWGDAAPILNTHEGGQFHKTYTYEFPENFVARHSRIVAFVNNKTTNVNNCKVLNATMSPNFTATAGIEDIETSDVNVYPNPASNYVVIEANEAIREIRVINIMGQEVYKAQENAEQVVVNTSDFANGLYVVSVRTENGTSVQRINVVR